MSISIEFVGMHAFVRSAKDAQEKWKAEGERVHIVVDSFEATDLQDDPAPLAPPPSAASPAVPQPAPEPAAHAHLHASSAAPPSHAPVAGRTESGGRAAHIPRLAIDVDDIVRTTRHSFDGESVTGRFDGDVDDIVALSQGKQWAVWELSGQLVTFDKSDASGKASEGPVRFKGKPLLADLGMIDPRHLREVYPSERVRAKYRLPEGVIRTIAEHREVYRGLQFRMNDQSEGTALINRVIYTASGGGEWVIRLTPLGRKPPRHWREVRVRPRSTIGAWSLPIDLSDPESKPRSGDSLGHFAMYGALLSKKVGAAGRPRLNAQLIAKRTLVVPVHCPPALMRATREQMTVQSESIY